jgi:hypothetical protein
VTGFSGGRQVTFEALEDGTTLVETYTVQVGDDISAIRIDTAKAFSGVDTDSQYTTLNLLTAIPENLRTTTTSHINFRLDEIDAAASTIVDGDKPEISVNSIDYTPSLDRITLKGSGFDTIGVADDTTDIKATLGLNSTKMTWDVDKSSTALDEEIDIIATSIDTAYVINDETLRINLKSTKADEIEGYTGYALVTADQITVQDEFFSDLRGNIGTFAEQDIVKNVNFTDTSAPQITSVTTTTSDGTYRVGDADIPIIITFNEPIKSSSTMTITLSTGQSVDLTYVSPDKVSGTYLIGTSDTTPGLDVQDITAVSVQDLYGIPVPSNVSTPDVFKNLTASKTINISNLQNASVSEKDPANGEVDAGDLLVFRFEDAVANKSDIVTELKAAIGGEETDYNWNPTDKVLNVTLGADEGLSVNSEDQLIIVLAVELTGQAELNSTFTFDF